MYTDEKPRRGGLLKEFILKLILIIIFVLLLIWLVPWPNMKALNPLKDQIFNANLQTMKEAGISYFTTERLPQNVGDKTTLTLQKMLDMKLVVPFTDKNGNTCDVKKSYVSLEKQETEYLMKVNLKCGEEEDYIIVNNEYWGVNYTKVDKTTYEKECPTPTYTPKTYTCRIVNNEYWGKFSKKVDKSTYEKECVNPTPTPPVTTYTCKIVNNEYWGKNAKVVDKATYEKECVIQPTPVVEKEYQYLKTEVKTENVKATYTDWSNWTTYTLKKGQSIPKSTETLLVEDLGEKRVAIGTKAAVYENIYEEHNEMVKYKTVTYKLCEDYNYVADATTIYKVLSDWAYTDDIKTGYRESIPYDTIDTRWVLQSVDYEVCKETCTSHPYGIYRKMTRKVQTTTEYTNVTAECAKVVEKSVDVYINVPVGKYYTVEKTPAQTVYGNIHQYRTKSRTLISEAYTKTIKNTSEKWSVYNDQTLITSGYVMTGQSRNKQK